MCSALDTREVGGVDTLTVEDVTTEAPPMLAEWAYHLGVRFDEIDGVVELTSVAIVDKPLYVPDGWHE
jgi:hypothetical protein